jgi:hypothetical protein
VPGLTVSKSMEVNLKRRRKKGGTFRVVLLWEEDIVSGREKEVAPGYAIVVCCSLESPCPLSSEAERTGLQFPDGGRVLGCR